MATSNGLQPPLLSAFDPVASGEGGVDPLGTGVTYERLAERVLPFLTVRMSRPRFLTAMAVGALVADEFGDRLAADDTTPPWLVFEWYVVEAFVRRRDAITGGVRGIPGIEKVSAALRKGQRLGHATYLKTATVFGFSGIYRRLAHGLEVLSDELGLDEGGSELLKAWEIEQGLDGFVSGATGPGAELRDELRRAVRAGLEKGYTSRPAGWPVWETLATKLDAGGARRKEADVIHRRLLRADLRQNKHDGEACVMRSEFFAALEKHGEAVYWDEEAAYRRSLMRRASPALRERLEEIDAYEGLCRPIEDAFRLMLHLSTARGMAPIDSLTYGREKRVQAIVRQLPVSVRKLAETFAGGPREAEVRDLVGRYGEVRDADALFETVIAHHEETQRAKPPEGKRPWIERLRDGVVVRPQYAHEQGPAGMDQYVHDYRTGTASNFLKDLRRLPR